LCHWKNGGKNENASHPKVENNHDEVEGK
jgi:hypothetical protein